jgi:hypothetical protein
MSRDESEADAVGNHPAGTIFATPAGRGAVMGTLRRLLHLMAA